MKKIISLSLMVFLFILCEVLQSQNIKLIPADGLDATELKSLVASVIKDCSTDQEKMIALWAFITRRPFYHWCEAREGLRATSEYGIVYDPIKAFNVYGTVICYQVADLLANMAQEAGIPARTRGFPYRHKVMEAFYDSAWHLFDAQYDCQAYYLKADGKSIASLNEVDADPINYVLYPSYPSDPFFQFDKFHGVFWPWEDRRWVVENWYEYFKTEDLGYSNPYDCQGHTITISLRRGEKLVRRWDNEGKWFCTAEMLKQWTGDYTQRWVALGPHDPRAPRNTYANGWLIYEPDWEASEVNFLDGLYGGENYRLVEGRVRPKHPGKAEVIFRVSSPYILAGHPNRLRVNGDSEDGALFSATFYRANGNSSGAVYVSTDNGTNWKKVWEDSRTGLHPVELDLTNFVEGNYSYLLRVGLESSRPEGVSFGHLKLKNSLHYSPVLLPGLKEGENRFILELAEPSEQLCLEPDFSGLEALKKSLLRLENLEYDTLFTNRLKPPAGATGSLILEVDPTGDSRIHWMTVYGSFGINPQDTEGNYLKISYAQETPDNWQVLWESSASDLGREWRFFSSDSGKPPLAGHWRFDKSVEAHPQKPVRKCFVKYELTRKNRLSLNDLKVYAYYEPDRPAGRPALSDISITHAWTGNGTLRQHTEIPRSEKHAYTVAVNDTLVINESVTLEVKNAGR